MTRSFHCAFSGVRQALRTERNMRIHLCALFYVVLFAAVCRVSPLEWCVLLLACLAVLAAELFNTAIERLCALRDFEFSDRIRMILDLSAGGVLVAAAFAAVVGGILFFSGGRLKIIFAFLYGPGGVFTLATLAAWMIFVCGKRRT